MSDIQAIRYRHDMDSTTLSYWDETTKVQAHRDRATLLSALSAAEARAEAAEARVRAYEAALDPNQTKHAYIGEIKNEDGRTIAWTATKETMAMIRARAARILKGAPDGR